MLTVIFTLLHFTPNSPRSYTKQYCRWQSAEHVPLTSKLKLAVLSMYCKCVTYLQLDNKTKAVVSLEIFSNLKSLRIVDQLLNLRYPQYPEYIPDHTQTNPIVSGPKRIYSPNFMKLTHLLLTEKQANSNEKETN